MFSKSSHFLGSDVVLKLYHKWRHDKQPISNINLTHIWQETHDAERALWVKQNTVRTRTQKNKIYAKCKIQYTWPKSSETQKFCEGRAPGSVSRRHCILGNEFCISRSCSVMRRCAYLYEFAISLRPVLQSCNGIVKQRITASHTALNELLTSCTVHSRSCYI